MQPISKGFMIMINIYKILPVIILLSISCKNSHEKDYVPVKTYRETRKYNEFNKGRKLIYPYGGIPSHKKNIMWVAPALLFDKKYKCKDIKIINSVDFSNSRFIDTLCLYNIYFTNKVSFENALFENYSDFSFDIFDSNAVFDYCQFNEVGFDFVDFEDNVNFTSCMYMKDVGYVLTYFKKKADFSSSQFIGSALFNRSRFISFADFRSTQFKGPAFFNQSRFMSFANFSNTVFDTIVDLSNIEYNEGISLENTVFKEKPILNETYFRNDIILSGAKFLKGLDLRRVYLDSVKMIVIDENTDYPDGELFVKWEQLRKCIKPVQKREYGADDVIYSRRYVDKYVCYAISKIVYKKLHDNYKIQGDDKSADDVMYELCKQREIYLKEWNWILYGWFLGWGYQPWRFIIFVLLPVGSIVAVSWYRLYIKNKKEKEVVGENIIINNKIIIKVDFSERMIVTVNGLNIPMMKTKKMCHEMLVFEELLNNGSIHWSSGLVLFRGWRTKILANGPVRQFGNEVDGLNLLLGHKVVKSTGDKRIWKFNDNVEIIESSIKKAEQKSLEALTKENIDSQLLTLIEAQKFYRKSIKVNCLVIDALQKLNNPEKITGEYKYLLFSAAKHLRERELNLKEAIQYIQTNASNDVWKGIWEGTEIYLESMTEELKRIVPQIVIANALKGKIHLNEDEILGLNISELLNNIKHCKSLDNTRNYYMGSLLNIQYIKNIILETKNIIINSYRYFVDEIADKDIEDTVSRSLWMFSLTKEYDFQSAASLRNYLIKCLKPMALYASIEDKYNIPQNEQKEMFKVIKVRTEIYQEYQQKHKPSDTEIINRLGRLWNTAKLERAYNNESKIRGQIDISNEWLLSRDHWDEIMSEIDDN